MTTNTKILIAVLLLGNIISAAGVWIEHLQFQAAISLCGSGENGAQP